MIDKPLIMFHGRSSVYGKPNSVGSITKATKYHVDIIELDIRKSRDGVLFCYHGSWLTWFIRYLNFNFIRKHLNTNTLEEILKVITTKKIIFLDIKDKRIIANDLKDVCNKFDLEYWVAGYDLKYLAQLKSVLNEYKFVYNFIFLNFKSGVKKAKQAGVNIIKVFRWQLSPNLKSHLLQSGLEFNVYPLFMSTETYLKKVEEFGSVWVAYDDLENLNKPYTGA